MKNLFAQKSGFWLSFKDGVFDFIKKILWLLGKNAFLVLLVLVLLDIFIGQWLLYNYVVLVKLGQPETTVELVLFKKDAYAVFVQEKTKRAGALENSQDGAISNPFR